MSSIRTWNEAVEALAKHLYPTTGKGGWKHETASTQSYYRLLAKHALNGVDARIISLAHLKDDGNALAGILGEK